MIPMGARMSEIGQRIRHLRKQRGWKQADLANMIDASPQLISFIERGERDGTRATLQKIADSFSISLGLLLDPSVDVEKVSVISEILEGLDELDSSQTEAVLQVIRGMASNR